ncbi:inorganic phosphate transporter [Flavobacteriaceae bacterium R38]|nr:inorganic phosphate transporter [Flavobacteriaceae bacterium R38]
MDNIYLLMIIALAVLAIADLVVGVSNDAVNFLNSAIGSKAISFRTIMILASIGIAFGAIFSSGLMEVARKGIFNPGEFYFNEIMFIFMAVMITDILLLDFFNTLGMPTSTTVSIVFELLGAAVAISLFKIYGGENNETFANLHTYINTATATKIIFGILLSVLVAFSVGAVVQYISRLIITFNFEKKAKWVGAVFGGIALTSIVYFIFIKGIKGTNYASSVVQTLHSGSADGLLEWANTYFNATFETVKDFIEAKKNILKVNSENNIVTVGMTLTGFLETYVIPIVIACLAILSLISYVFIIFFNVNIYRVVIAIGTFALALAFAGNDLVNFIGVPIAGWQSYEAWVASGVPAGEFSMDVLSSKVNTPTLLLLFAGIIMILTLWFSTKAKKVVKTSIDLSSQEATQERFQPNFLSRGFVRFAISLSKTVTSVLPESTKKNIEERFEKPMVSIISRKQDKPAFDMVRAAVNLMVASVLISMATSYKLPLSTTYVTFMVAMGTSLADRAWGSESAVYRVAGVLNVIGGWFFTAISAFIAAAIMASLIRVGGSPVIAGLLFVAVVLLIRNYIKHNKKVKEAKVENRLRKAESRSIKGVIEESADNISNVVDRCNKIYTTTINGLAVQDLAKLKKSKRGVFKLNNEIDELRDNIFYFIKNLDETSVGVSKFYVLILGYLQDMAQSMEYITKVSHKHINNNHKKLRFNQIKELKEVEQKLSILFDKIKAAFDNRNFNEIGLLLEEKQELLEQVAQKIEKQIERTRTADESSPKNTTLYFSLLLESKDLIEATMKLLEEYDTEGKKDNNLL